jgi:hypothetical protein
VLTAQKFSDIEGLTRTGVQRTGTFVDLLAELAELFHVRQQSPPDLFLVGIR